MFDFSIAIILLLIAAALVTWYLRYKAGSSERRMKLMMQHAGLDPEKVESGEAEAVIRELRRQCRRCQSEDLCERWLAGKESGAIDFCPNVEIFRDLRQKAAT